MRGQVVPVVNLRRVFGLPAGEPTKEARIMVVNVADRNIGCLVDAVTGVLRISADSVEPPSPLVTASGESDYLLGIAKLDDRMVLLLELQSLFGFDEMTEALDTVGQQRLDLEPEQVHAT